MFSIILKHHSWGLLDVEVIYSVVVSFVIYTDVGNEATACAYVLITYDIIDFSVCK